MAPMSPISTAIRLITATAIFAALLFVLAGTIAWPVAWAYLVVLSASLVVYSVILNTIHPDLVDERRHPPGDAKKWDRPFVAVVGAFGPLLMFAVCGLDRRFGWTHPMPAWLNAVGLLLVIAGQSLTNYAVAANRFFSAFIRIQRDRGHHVVDSGPYRLVRHPGYLGSIVHMFGTGLALGSLYALDIAAVLSLVLAVRTWLEDRTLRSELDGYAAYAGRVRFRLLPGIW